MILHEDLPLEFQHTPAFLKKGLAKRLAVRIVHFVNRTCTTPVKADRQVKRQVAMFKERLAEWKRERDPARKERTALEIFERMYRARAALEKAHELRGQPEPREIDMPFASLTDVESQRTDLKVEWRI